MAASSLEEEVAMLRAEVLAVAGVGHNSACGLRLEVWQCLGMPGRSRSLLVTDFLQRGYRIAQELLGNLGSRNSGGILVILQCIDTPLCR